MNAAKRRILLTDDSFSKEKPKPAVARRQKKETWYEIGDGVTNVHILSLKPPVRERSIRVFCAGKIASDSSYGKGGTIVSKDRWVSGNVDYRSGRLTLRFAQPPASGTRVIVVHE